MAVTARCVADVRQWVEWLDACGVTDGTPISPDELLALTFPRAVRD